MGKMKLFATTILGFLAVAQASPITKSQQNKIASIRNKAQNKAEALLQNAANQYGMDVDVDKLFKSFENAAAPFIQEAMNKAQQAQGSNQAARAQQNVQQVQKQAKAIFNQNKNKNLGELYQMLTGVVAGQIANIDNPQLKIWLKKQEKPSINRSSSKSETK